MFKRTVATLAAKSHQPGSPMIDATDLRTHPTAASLLKNGVLPRSIGRSSGGLNSKLFTVCAGKDRPRVMPLTQGQTSDYKGAALWLAAALTLWTGWDYMRAGIKHVIDDPR